MVSAQPQSQLLPLDPDLPYEEDVVARFLHVKPETLKVWRCTGRYPALRYRKAGARVLYFGRDVLAFLDAPHQKAKPYIPKNQRPKVVKPAVRRRSRRGKP